MAQVQPARQYTLTRVRTQIRIPEHTSTTPITLTRLSSRGHLLATLGQGAGALVDIVMDGLKRVLWGPGLDPKDPGVDISPPASAPPKAIDAVTAPVASKAAAPAAAAVDEDAAAPALRWRKAPAAVVRIVGHGRRGLLGRRVGTTGSPDRTPLIPPGRRRTPALMHPSLLPRPWEAGRARLNVDDGVGLWPACHKGFCESGTKSSLQFIGP